VARTGGENPLHTSHTRAATLGALSRMMLGASSYFIIPVVPDDFGRVTVSMFTKDFFAQAVLEIASAGRQDRPLCGSLIFN